jgi:hypothetical protein
MREWDLGGTALSGMVGVWWPGLENSVGKWHKQKTAGTLKEQQGH